MSRLLNESWIEGVPDPIVENLEALNRYVVLRICERIRKIGDIGAADAHRLKSAVEYAAGDLRAIEAEIARITKQNVKDIDALFEEVAAENLDFASVFFAARDMDPIQNYAQVAALDSFVRAAKAQAMDGVTNISNTHMIGFKRGRAVVPLREYYISAIDRAITFVQTGTVDYHTAVRSTVKDMAKSGLRRVTFESGYSRRLDSQARMNILEGVRRLNGEMMEETGRRFGADGVEISAHGLCAPDHIDIQGRQYRKAEWERINGGLKRPIGTLNCHHYATPIIYGVSRPVYSRQELAEINRRSSETVKWKDIEMTRYEASQKQRQLETAIRYAKDERDAMTAEGDKLGAAQARKKSAALGREYKAFCEKTGLTPRLERTRSMTGATIAGIKKVPTPAKPVLTPVIPTKWLDVTEQYRRSAKPGIGDITYDAGYKTGQHRDEIFMADWLHRTFGGEIKLLVESDVKGQTMPDFLWNEKFWELKGALSVNSADKLLQHALKQIQDKPGGVILNILADIDMTSLEKQLLRRAARSKIDLFDLILLSKGELSEILRYKK